jgi:hypothetical protein
MSDLADLRSCRKSIDLQDLADELEMHDSRSRFASPQPGRRMAAERVERAKGIEPSTYSLGS